MRYLTVIWLVLVVSACTAQEGVTARDPQNVYSVYFLGGQSNMEGYGFVDEVPEAYRSMSPNVLIFQGRMVPDGGAGGGRGLWGPLSLGHGTGFTTDGIANTISDRFGPELSFGLSLVQNEPSAKIAIIKYSRGGTALVDGVSGYGSWDPDYDQGNRRNQYDNALTTIQNAMATRDINGDGYADRLVPAGIIWMQGEADAYDDPIAADSYDANLARLMDLLRAAFHRDDLPIVIGQIMDSGNTPQSRKMAYSPNVQAAQRAYTESDPCAALVTVTENFDFLPDGWHYLSENYIRLGQAFAQSVVEIEEKCPASP